MAKKKHDEEIGSIFDQFGVEDPFADKDDPEDDEGAKDDKSGSGEPSTKELMARLDNLEKENERLQRSNMALMSASPGGSQQQPQTPDLPEVDLSGLPDPNDDPQGYQKGLNERLSKTIRESVEVLQRNQQQTQQYQQQGQQRTDELWNQFTSQYEDLAQHSDVVEFAADKAIRKAKARGVDVDKYMFTTPELFFADIEAEARKLLPADGEGGGSEKGGKETEEDNENDDDGRAAAMFGGQESGGKSGGGKEAEKPGDFIKDLHDLQRASGFF